MAKFHGTIGYAQASVETEPGVFKPGISTRPCTGEILRNSQKWENTQQLNDNFTINNRFSIIADGYINQNLKKLRYLEWNGVRWKITSVEIEPPRVILTVGGVYNG